jgi:hypothetical protein
MVILNITKDQIKRASELYSFTSLNGSITKGKSNKYGALGEVLVFDYFKDKGLEVSFESTFDYDLIIQGYTIDVKTKRTTVTPKHHYLCSISAFNTKQKCNLYFFVRIKEDFSNAYLLGYKKKKVFFEYATFNKKGSLDVNGWTFKDDCYNLPIGDLDSFKI